MSIIQNIRDKGTVIVIGVISLSLIGFLLMDARSGAAKGLFGGGDSKTIGIVNGKDIGIDEFNAKVKDAEAQYPNTNGGVRQQIMSLIHISEPTRLGMISYAVFCLKKKK